ncbi:MAG TPA: ATP-dependent Clp protease ATP-binding subunit ClpX, partial [Chloroflexota bacterium]|nr:ATP-dependent Clp protease ATP-binding subunit ClpX [Chloroflexota bacterium]
TEPKNAIVKQYQKFLALDKVELVMTPEALDAAAEEALKLKTGARGLRTVIEEILLDVMYEIPSRSDVKKCVINAETIHNRKSPLLVNSSGRPVDEIPMEGRSA